MVLEKEMMVYKAENKINGKIYIGKTINSFAKRKSGHKYNAFKCSSKYPFHSALRKYGFENFEWSIIDTAENEDKLNGKEVYWIKFYNTTNKKYGYNLTNGGDGISGWKHSEKTKRKYSEDRRGEKHPMYGKHHSEESKKKLSESLKGKYIGEKSYFFGKKFLGIDNLFFGKTHTKEVRLKISEANKNRKPISEETRLKMSESRKGKKYFDFKGEKNPFYGKKHSEESKKKISNNHARPWIDRKHTEETKLKMAKARKKYWENKKNEHISNNPGI
jgi:group I intron endonuclease